MIGTKATALVSIVAVLSLGMNAQQPSPVTLTISTPAATLRPGEPVRLNVAVGNASSETLVVDKASAQDGRAEAFVDVEVRDASGNALPRIDGTPFVSNGKQHMIPKRWLTRKGANVAPGDILRDYMMLNKIFDFTKPGTYSVSAKIAIRAPDSGPEIHWLQASSNAVKITIAP
jgi:hypothetical protein